MISFPSFLIEQSRRLDKVGDIARDLLADNQLKMSGDFTDLYSHLISKPRSQFNALQYLKIAYEEYCSKFRVNPNYAGTEWEKPVIV